MDLSTLESIVKALEDSLDSWGNWLVFFTVLVVFGLLFEYYHEIRDLIREHPFRLRHFFRVAGAALVTLGVAGELFVEFKASSAETKLRDANRKVESLLRQNSDNAQMVSGAAGAVAAGANLAAASANERAADAEKATENERTARIELEANVAWRELPKKVKFQWHLDSVVSLDSQLT